MRRIALLAFVLLALPTAAAHADNTCADLTYHGYDAVGIQELGMGCRAAHHVAKQVILHGSSQNAGLPCTRSALPKGVTLWTCSGIEHGHKSRVEFGVRLSAHGPPTPTAPVVTCSTLSAYGYRAQNIRERGLGCEFAHQLVRSLILHGSSGHANIQCTRMDATHVYWSCAGQVHEDGVRLTFYLVQTRAVAFRARAAAEVCRPLHFGGFTAAGFLYVGFNCHDAHGIARHVISHGTSGFARIACRRDGTRWGCGYEHPPGRSFVSFDLRRSRVVVTHR
ncbi:MAG: hypothetical protein ACJ762_05650 [Solirubrobacteraceae bacterium]